MIRLIAFLLALVSGTAAADAPFIWKAPAASNGTYTLNVNVPDSVNGGNYAAKADVYVPAGGAPAGVVVFWPGGSGSKADFCYSLKVCTANPVTSEAQVNFALLNGYNIAAIFPDIQAPSGGIDHCNYSQFTGSVTASTTLVVSAVGANHALVAAGQELYTGTTDTGFHIVSQSTGSAGGTGNYVISGSTTITSQTITGYPTAPAGGATTECNRTMTPGEDTVQRAIDISNWISTGCTTSGIQYCGTGCGSAGTGTCKYSFGHSNGAMFGERIKCEDAAYYLRFIDVSGPLGIWWDPAGAHPCSPTLKRAELYIIGGQDNVVGAYGGDAGGGSHWNATTWISSTATYALNDISRPSVWVPFPISACDWVNQVTNATTCTGGTLPDPGATGCGGTFGSGVGSVTCISSGTETIWKYDNGCIQVDRIDSANHTVSDMQTKLGARLVNVALAWLKSLGSC